VGAIDQVEAVLSSSGESLTGYAASSDEKTLPLQTALFLPDGTSGSFGIMVTAYRQQSPVGSGASDGLVQVSPGVPGKATIDLIGHELVDGGSDGSLPDLAGSDRPDLGPSIDLALGDLGTSCPVGALLCDDFENGLSPKWVLAPPSLGATLADQMGTAHSGSHALVANDNGAGGTAYLTFDITGLRGTAVSFRFFINFMTAPTGHYTTFVSLGVPTVQTSPAAVVDHSTVTNQEEWKIWVGDGNSAFSKVPLGSSWHCIELDLDFTKNTEQLFIDDASAAFAQPAAGLSTFNTIYFGLAHTPSAMPSVSFLDDVVIAHQHIGCQ
jgi:hypothetical protein